MITIRTVCGMGLVLLLALSASGDDDLKATYDALKKLASMDGDMKKAGAEAAKKKEMELEAVMQAFKLPSKGGLGFGEKPGPADGLEVKLVALARKELSKKEIDCQVKDLVMLARISAAIAAVALPQCPVDKPAAKDLARWQEGCDNMYNAALELAKASQVRDGGAIKAAAKKLNRSCNACHALLRGVAIPPCPPCIFF
jgi:hypothetical protein